MANNKKTGTSVVTADNRTAQTYTPAPIVKNKETETPPPTPIPLAPAVEPKPTNLPMAATDTQTAKPLSYTPQQSYAETDYPYWLSIVNQEQQSNAANPDRHTAFTNEEMNQKYAEAGIDPSGQYVNPSRNMGSTDPNYQSTTTRDHAAGTSGGDEYWLSDAELAYVRYCQEMYGKATTQAEKDYWHAEAEKTRARYDYSGGTDGSMFLSTMKGVGSNGGANGAAPGATSSGATGGASDLKSLLDAWQQAALQQSNAQNDYAVQQAVAELERALADAQPQFKEQAESVDRDARQAMDNSALYAELRGDKGGIGQEQYNSIQNTQAQNHLSVQQAQTKLATDTQRQIADLRAQGEFEKADAALQITQQYLAQLISLEQWAAEYNLSVDQFNESIRQWEAEYNMAMQQLQLSQNQWQAEFDAAQNQWQAEFDYTKQLNSQNRLASMGEALLSAGIPLTDEQLKAMEISGEQASQLLIQAQLAAAQQGSETTSGFFKTALNHAEDMVKAKSSPQAIMAYLEGLVDRGQISADESVHIYLNYLGLPIITPGRNTDIESMSINTVN